jgi:hypothetical protein
MKEGDQVKVFWEENGQLVRDCLYGDSVGTVVKDASSFAFVRIRNRYRKTVVRKFSKHRLKLFCKSLF